MCQNVGIMIIFADRAFVKLIFNLIHIVQHKYTLHIKIQIHVTPFLQFNFFNQFSRLKYINIDK